MGKWESCFWISTFPWPALNLPPPVFSPGFGAHWEIVEAVEMWESRVVCEISKGCGKDGKPAFGFPGFPLPGISIAWFFPQPKRGGTGDSLLHFRNSLVFAVPIFLAASVSLMARANLSNCAKLMFSLRYCAGAGNDFSFSYGVA